VLAHHFLRMIYICRFIFMPASLCSRIWTSPSYKNIHEDADCFCHYMFFHFTYLGALHFLRDYCVVLNWTKQNCIKARIYVCILKSLLNFNFWYFTVVLQPSQKCARCFFFPRALYFQTLVKCVLPESMNSQSHETVICGFRLKNVL
jgi:hypothetical protein